jgi:hypothetical protein
LIKRKQEGISFIMTDCRKGYARSAEAKEKTTIIFTVNHVGPKVRNTNHDIRIWKGTEVMSARGGANGPGKGYAPTAGESVIIQGSNNATDVGRTLGCDGVSGRIKFSNKNVRG